MAKRKIHSLNYFQVTRLNIMHPTQVKNKPRKQEEGINKDKSRNQ